MSEVEHDVLRREDGTVEREEWRLDGLLHRADGPAKVEYWTDGSVKHETWHLTGRRLRPAEPVRR